MALLVAGIDEAGYGPVLGPLCVGMSALRIEGWQPGDATPDCWSLLAAAVCKSPRDKRGRVAVDDSKKLKLANDGARHPLTHLERGVLAFLAAKGERPTSDRGLLAALGARLEEAGCELGGGEPYPHASTPEQVGIAGNVLSRALGEAGMRVEHLRCLAVGVPEFNRLVREGGSKAAAPAAQIGVYLREIWGSHAGEAGLAVRVVCDRQGGRTDYEGYLSRLVPGSRIEVLEQTVERGRYELKGAGRSMVVIFQTQAESRCLPVALASMAAKLVRETAMAGFNRFWSSRVPELKPTAGYATDGARWLREAGGVLTPAERERLVRIA